MRKVVATTRLQSCIPKKWQMHWLRRSILVWHAAISTGTGGQAGRERELACLACEECSEDAGIRDYVQILDGIDIRFGAME